MSENNPIELIAVLLILFGAIFCFLSSLGLIRLPDVYTRSHAASKSSTMGVLFTLVGTFVFFIIEGTFSIRLFLGIFFVFLTSPVASHVVVRSAYRSKVKLADVTVQDDLKAEIEEEGIETIEVQHK
ncbi:monovalent cation/H(+) antiporter subunit G [Niallia sp. FSL W8-0635]|uniref:monovalent cation/H(+) antiporter subunit G n=1 Tax=Niallia sp. FSL W8-0635 TaxID=2975337 RepID=UPI0009D478FA|nr:monovalent cation/proton antiporter subunit MnhG/PhaG [Mycobacteroides abscessus subsp. abscessus]HEO8420382.1 Na+/H+ antiporter subunit G [Yersinia enterocolitica]